MAVMELLELKVELVVYKFSTKQNRILLLIVLIKVNILTIFNFKLKLSINNNVKNCYKLFSFLFLSFF